MFPYALELKYRILYILLAFIVNVYVCYLNADMLLNILLTPIASLSNRLMLTDLKELFIIYIKLAYSFGFYLTLIVIGFQTYAFFITGLYKSEQKQLHYFFLISVVTILLFFVLLFYIIIPQLCQYFLNSTYINHFGIELQMSQLILIRIQEYLLFMLLLFRYAVLLFLFLLIPSFYIYTRRGDISRMIHILRKIFYIIMFTLFVNIPL